MCDWPSNFNFNYIGSLRCMAQIICYEVKITIILLSLIQIIYRFDLIDKFTKISM